MIQFEECIIHIGTMKTGTTTLQEFFRHNKSNLAKRGFLFPTTLGKHTHELLTALTLDNKKKDAQKKILVINGINFLNFHDEITNLFEQEIKTENLSNMLLSAESMSLLLTSDEEIQHLKKFLDKYCKTFKIIIYLRPQHELGISNFSTNCKQGATKKKFFLENDIKKGFFDYEKLLDRWERVFGFENIIPRIFSKDELHEGDIKKDFCNIFGWNWNKFHDIKNVNESINAEAQLFLIEINKFIPRFVGNKLNPYREDLADLVFVGNEGKGLLPTRKDTEEFLAMYEESNDKVRKKWFPERNGLFKFDLSKYPEKPDMDTDYKFAFKIFAKVWKLKQDQLFALRKENEQLKKLLEKIGRENN